MLTADMDTVAVLGVIGHGDTCGSVGTLVELAVLLKQLLYHHCRAFLILIYRLQGKAQY